MAKYRVPNLKAHLEASGLTMTKLRQRAHAIVGDDDVGGRTWANALNSEGVSLTSANAIVDVTRRTFKHLEKPCPDSALLIVEVMQPSAQPESASNA